jgi:hypothetical protein
MKFSIRDCCHKAIFAFYQSQLICQILSTNRHLELLVSHVKFGQIELCSKFKKKLLMLILEAHKSQMHNLLQCHHTTLELLFS